MIRNPKPLNIAIFVSLILSFVLGLVTLFIDGFDWLGAIIIFTLSFGLSFFFVFLHP